MPAQPGLVEAVVIVGQRPAGRLVLGHARRQRKADRPVQLQRGPGVAQIDRGELLIGLRNADGITALFNRKLERARRHILFVAFEDIAAGDAYRAARLNGAGKNAARRAAGAARRAARVAGGHG